MVHADHFPGAIQLVRDFITGGNLFGIVDGFASLLRRLHHVSLLHSLLDLVAGVAASRRAGDGRCVAAAAAADLAAEHPADDRADRGTRDALLILDWRLLQGRVIAANLARNPSRIKCGFHGYYSGVILNRVVSRADRDRPSRRYRDRADDDPGHQLAVHYSTSLSGFRRRS